MDNKNSWIKDWEIQSGKDEMRRGQPDNLSGIKIDAGQDLGEKYSSKEAGKKAEWQDFAPNMPKKKNLWPWIMTAVVAVVALIITITTKGEDKEEVPFADQVENFVNRTESLSLSFDASGWNSADAEFGAHLTMIQKGEFYLMQGRAGKALFMWNKVLETDPNFLNMYGGHTNLYDGLVEKEMIN